MATVTVITAERTLAIEAASITSGEINSAGHLVLTRHDDTPIDMGAVSGMQYDTGSSYSKVDAFAYVGDTNPGAVPDGSIWYDTTTVAGPFASSTKKGLVELATNSETIAGTDDTRAVTPASLAAIPGNRVQILASNLNAESALPSSYPSGLSLLPLSTGSGWSINSGFGSVFTQKSDTDRTVQLAYSNPGGLGSPRSWIRQYHTSNNGGGWTAWSQFSTVATLVPASFTQVTTFFSYPDGNSRLYYTTANSGSWDFTGKAGEVLTFSDGVDYARQTWTRHVGGSSATPEFWIRTATAANGWSKWLHNGDDTGWVNLAYASGYTALDTGERLKYRVRNGVVHINGGANGSYPAGNYSIIVATGGIPAEYRPSEAIRGGAMGAGLRPGGFQVSTGGEVAMGSAGLSSQPTWMSMSTSYPKT